MFLLVASSPVYGCHALTVTVLKRVGGGGGGGGGGRGGGGGGRGGRGAR